MIHGMSMNRTAAGALFCLAQVIGVTAAQAPGEIPTKDPQGAAVTALVAIMAKSETALTSLRLTMTTTGKIPRAGDITTRGEVRVLRATQAGLGSRLFTRLEYAFGDGFKGRMEVAQTKDGIVTFQEDPAFGAVFLQFPVDVVADLEWASGILKRSDLPGMVDSRAQSPLGSGMVKDLLRTFDLAVAPDREHAGDQGTWLRGARRAGLDAQDPDLPLADRVEVFVRERDHALLLTRFFVGTDVVQELVVEKLEVGAKLVAADFTVDGHGERIRNVRDYAPMWEQVIEVIGSAEAKANEGDERPSKRKAPDGGTPGGGTPGGGK